MVVKSTFKDIYANHVARVLLLAKLLIQRLYGATTFLVSKLFFNLVSDMV
jgi:hypothetical protein